MTKDQFFAETAGRMIVTVPVEHTAAFEAALGTAVTKVGEVTNSHWLQVRLADGQVNENVQTLQTIWEEAIPCQLKSKD